MSEPREIFCDTNCLIDIYRGRSSVRPIFDGVLQRQLMPYISVITEAELWRGVRVTESSGRSAASAPTAIAGYLTIAGR